MNERIRELYRQAHTVRTYDGDPMRDGNPPTVYWQDEVSAEKFADLIVKECTQLLFAESERLYAYSSECDNMRHSDEAELCAEKCMDNIKMLEEHFGVE